MGEVKANGAGASMPEDEVRGWVIVWANGKQYIGQPEYLDAEPLDREGHRPLRALGPIYDLQAVRTMRPALTPDGRPVMGPNGPVMLDTKQWIASTVLFFYSLKRLPMPTGAVYEYIDDRALEERRRLGNAIINAERDAEDMRAQDAGVQRGGLVALPGRS